MSDTTERAEPAGLDPGRRKAILGVTLAVVVVIVAALGYAVVRDPGPQPPIPPKISGTDDGGIKRAVVHYVGALASRDPEVMTDLWDNDDARARALAKIVVDEFGDVAQQKATVVVEDSEDFGSLKYATITFADGRVQKASVTTTGPGEHWTVSPQTDKPLPESEPDGPAATTPSASVPAGG